MSDYSINVCHLPEQKAKCRQNLSFFLHNYHRHLAQDMTHSSSSINNLLNELMNDKVIWQPKKNKKQF